MSHTSTADGFANFPEVCTAVGAFLDRDEQMHLLTPHGPKTME
ncbi:nucleotidyltransferase family protein [Alicyclobacillus sp. SO9]|nr:nucleotidyltransferase family protein [Alicyclobacillus sp. SO9]